MKDDRNPAAGLRRGRRLKEKIFGVVMDSTQTTQPIIARPIQIKFHFKLPVVLHFYALNISASWSDIILGRQGEFSCAYQPHLAGDTGGRASTRVSRACI